MPPFEEPIAFSAGDKYPHVFCLLNILRMENRALLIDFRHDSGNGGHPRYERRMEQTDHVSKGDSLRETEQVHFFDRIR